jgi:hypothetical protein
MRTGRLLTEGLPARLAIRRPTLRTLPALRTIRLLALLVLLALLAIGLLALLAVLALLAMLAIGLLVLRSDVRRDGLGVRRLARLRRPGPHVPRLL